MTVSKINPEDIDLINKIFNLSETLIVFDPKGKLVILIENINRFIVLNF